MVAVLVIILGLCNPGDLLISRKGTLYNCQVPHGHLVTGWISFPVCFLKLRYGVIDNAYSGTYDLSCHVFVVSSSCTIFNASIHFADC